MSGYKGFRSWANQECPSLKPGESYASRDTKFQSIGKQYVGAAPLALGNATYSTQTNDSFGRVQPKDFKVPDRRGVMAHKDEKAQSFTQRKCLGKSTYQQSFEETAAIQKTMEGGIVPEEKYKEAYASVAMNNGFPIKAMAQFLTLAQGCEPQDRVLRLYEKELESVHSDVISWDVLMKAVHRVNAYFTKEQEAGMGKIVSPAWMVKNAPQKVLKGRTGSSSHQIDFGTYGSDPLSRPYVRKTGMASTTLDLATGTSRSANHVPGYEGFIPQAKNNPEAVAQGDGTEPRNRGEYLRLYHRDNLPGYAGHSPACCTNYRGEMTTGADPKTTNGATYLKLK